MKEVKTVHSKREVYLSASVKKALWKHKQQQEPNSLDLVVPSRTGGYLDPVICYENINP